MNNIQRIKHIDDLYDLSLSQDTENDDVKDWNNDTQKLVDQHLMLAKRLKTQLKAQVLEEKHTAILVFMSKIKEGLDSNKEKYKDFASKLFQNPKYSQLQPLFSNLDSLSDSDEMAILLDAKLMQLLDDVEIEFDDLDGKD